MRAVQFVVSCASGLLEVGVSRRKRVHGQETNRIGNHSSLQRSGFLKQFSFPLSRDAQKACRVQIAPTHFLSGGVSEHGKPFLVSGRRRRCVTLDALTA